MRLFIGILLAAAMLIGGGDAKPLRRSVYNKVVSALMPSSLVERTQRALPPHYHPEDVECAKHSKDIYDACITSSNCDVAYSIRYDIVEHDDKCYVVFRGTVDIRNWITDAQFWQSANQFGRGQVHNGFQDAYNHLKLEAIYDRVVHKCQRENKKMYFTGHSLGGAVATLAILDFHNEFPNHEVRFATFGSPRVGDPAFQADFLSKLAGKGNRYEAVKAPVEYPCWLGFSTCVLSPAGDGAKPGDPIPRLPPLNNVILKVSEIGDPDFWESTSLDTLFGDMRSAGGYRHVGRRMQIHCNDILLFSCHSMEHVYYPEILAGRIYEV